MVILGIRMLDAVINRTAEGLRVLEDHFRFIKNDKHITAELKEIRHTVRSLASAGELVRYRDTEKDVGSPNNAETNLDRRVDTQHLVAANFRRVSESLRTLEEVLKTSSYADGKKAETLRYRVYCIEKSALCYMRPAIPTGLYGITGEEFSKGRDNPECVKAMLDGGVRIIQYRAKNKHMGEKLAQSRVIADLCRKAGAVFIVNDHVDIALLVNADGVHVGQEDLPPSCVRGLIGPDKIIGLSTHNPDQGKAALKEDVDYIGAGPLFKTPSKPGREPVGLEYLDFVLENITLPSIAIGGIVDDNFQSIVDRGAKRICMVSELVGADDIAAKAKRLTGQMKVV